jgi:hypothetical protein
LRARISDVLEEGFFEQADAALSTAARYISSIG